MDEPRLLAMRDVIDGQLRTLDDRRVGRVADLRAEWRADGSLIVTDLVVGPEALAGRVFRWAGALARRLFRGRFDHRIAIPEVEELGPTVHLRRRREDYDLGHLDEWLVEHVVRWIPGSGG